MHIQPPVPDCMDVEVGSVTSGGGSLFRFGVFAPVSSGETSSGHTDGLSQPSFISSMSAGAKVAGGIVLPSGWGRGRGRPAIDLTSPSGVDKRSRSKGEEVLGRSDSADSGVRRRLRGKQSCSARTPSGAPSDGIGHPATGDRYFPHVALASVSGC